MGNKEAAPIQTEFIISSHNPLQSGSWVVSHNRRTRRSRNIISTSQCVLSATIDSTPAFQYLSYKCPFCRTECFDAGLPKRVRCDCNRFLFRDAYEEIIEVSADDAYQFDENFAEHKHKPSGKFIPELRTLTLGIFRAGVPAEFIINSRGDFSVIFDSYLSPFFKGSLRCLGIGDYFQYNNARFKVLGSFPSFGVVTEKTLISCSDVLNINPIERVHILPISPTIFTDRTFPDLIQPYFKESIRHITSGEYIYIDRHSFIITASQPQDGIITSDTQFFFNGSPLLLITHFNIVPYWEDLTHHYHSLDRDKLIEEILNNYLMPYFQGFRRVISKNQQIAINGVFFKVVECWPEKGVTLDSTRIVYDGSMFRREMTEYFSPNVLLVRRGNLMDDPLFMMSQHMAQMQRIMMEVGIHEQRGSRPETIQNLPVRIIRELPEDPEASKCMVCLCPYVLEEEAKTLRCCNNYLVHMFHSNCIDEWLKISKYCPLCKADVEQNEIH